jgi:hypothetical protein
MPRSLAALCASALTVALLGVLTPPPASAADDPVLRRAAVLTNAGVASPSSPAQQLARVSVVQDLTTSTFSADVAMAGTPSASEPAVAYVHLGRIVDGDCVTGAVLVGVPEGSTTTAGQIVAAHGQAAATFPVTRSYAGGVLSLSGSHPSFGSFAYDCAFALSKNPGGDVIYNGLLQARLTDQVAPRLRLDAGEPLKGSATRKWTEVEVEVANLSEGAAGAVTLRASGKGLKIQTPTLTVGDIEGRRDSDQTVRVKLKGKKPRTLTLTATAAGGYSATTKVTIARAAKPTRLRSLAGRYYWGFETGRLDVGWSNVALWFTDDRFVHLGFPEKAGQPTCARVSKTCKRYTYDPRTGKVRVGKQSGRVTSASLKLGKQTYNPLSLPKRGSRLEVALIRHDYTGFCGTSCVTWTERLFLDRQGRFTQTRLTIGSIGAPGTGTTSSVVPPDQTGTYQVLGKGRIRLSYADGTRRTTTLGVEQDLTGKPNAGVAGVVLGELNFYWD